jgi:ankyrin repeat protein
LAWAARRGRLKMAALLLQAGADLNAVDHSGSSALHHACSVQDGGMVRFLIANGADVSLVDGDGAAAIQLADEETLLVFMQAVLALRQQASTGEKVG